MVGFGIHFTGRPKKTGWCIARVWGVEEQDKNNSWGKVGGAGLVWDLELCVRLAKSETQVDIFPQIDIW